MNEGTKLKVKEPRRDSTKKNNFFKLDLAVLAALNKQDAYGYEITTILKEQTNNLFQVREGVLYPILYRLNQEGLISSESRTVNGRNRIYYHLEKIGREYMQELLKEYVEGQQILNQYLMWTGCMESGQQHEKIGKDLSGSDPETETRPEKKALPDSESSQKETSAA